jgi:hypothetical protein
MALIVDFFVAFKAAGVNHPNSDKDEVLKMSAEQSGYAEHRMDPQTVIIVDEKHRGGRIGITGRNWEGVVR